MHRISILIVDLSLIRSRRYKKKDFQLKANLSSYNLFGIQAKTIEEDIAV